MHIGFARCTPTISWKLYKSINKHIMKDSSKEKKKDHVTIVTSYLENSVPPTNILYYKSLYIQLHSPKTQNKIWRKSLVTLIVNIIYLSFSPEIRKKKRWTKWKSLNSEVHRFKHSIPDKYNLILTYEKQHLKYPKNKQDP